MTEVDRSTADRDPLQQVLRDTDADSAEPLSAEQRRWWLLNRMTNRLPSVVLGRFEILESISLAELQLRLNRMAAEQEALRSVFTEVEGRPVRLVLPLAEVALRRVDLTDRSDPDAVIARVSADTAAEPFDVEHGPLLRVVVFELTGQRTELLLVAHRLICDRSSLEAIVDELTGGFTGCRERLAEVLQEQRRSQQDGQDRTTLTSLGERLVAPSAREIPTVRPRPEVKQQRRATETVEVPIALPYGEQDTDAVRHRVVAAWLAVLMRYQASDSAQCGVYVDRPPHLRSVIGPLDEVQPIRVDPPVDGGLDEVVAAVAAELGAVVDRPVSFARLLEVCPPERDLSRTPYLQTTVRVIDVRAREKSGPAPTRFRALPAEIGTGDHDLDLEVWVHDDHLVFHIDYDSTLYPDDEVPGVASSMAVVLGELVEGNVTLGVHEIPLLSGPDVTTSRGRGARYAESDDTLVDLVSRNVEDPVIAQRTAVFCGGVEVTYRELWARSGVIASALQRYGVRAGHRVGIRLRRGPDAIAVQLAVLRVGAAFVPIDPGHPADRVRYLLTDSGATVVVTEAAVDVIDRLSVPTVRLDEIDVENDRPQPVPVRADDPAYVIYTSGSTGHPKGVVVRHRNVVNNLSWRQRTWPLYGDDRILHNHALSFDPSVWAVYWPLSAGATIVLAVEDELDDPSALLELLRDEKVTVLGGVPSLLKLLLAHPAAGEASKVRLLLSGAEPLETDLIERAEHVWSAQVVNLYGPTETTIDATAHVVSGDRRRVIPIGSAIDNVDVHVLDANLRPVPDMVPGELFIGGAGVAVGYCGRPELTAARFLPDPFGEPGRRVYRTGDLGRRWPDGSIEFLGRVDDQVKIRGHRVELREVETILSGCTTVSAAAVVALHPGTEFARLAAAFVRASDPDTVALSEAELTAAVRAELAQRLPHYLVPDVLKEVSVLPRTRSGKIDRQAISAALDVPMVEDRTGTPPRTPLEEAIAADFASVLRVETVDVHRDFFDFGGTSIMLAQLATLLQERHKVDIPLHEFFRVPTVAGVAETLETYRRGGLAAVLRQQHAATLERDGCLDEAVRPDGLPRADWFRPRRVLLTGVTGYLGLHLLEELLGRTDAEIVCLVRAKDTAHAMERIRQGLAEYEIDVADRLHRVRCVVGDLAEDRLGLDLAEWQELADTVDVLYHNGALVNFVYPYSALKAPNVGGTQRVLELACTSRLKAVHHVSTIDTLLATHSPRPFLEDDTPLQSAVNVPAGYTGSKWVAEKIVNVARQRGIPVTVFRPSLIMGHTRTGATQSTDYLLVAFRGYLPMGILPDYPRIFDTVPVDYVAAAVVHISLQNTAIGGFYHLFNPEPVSLRTFCGWLTDYGYQFDIVPFEEGRRRAIEVGPGHPLYPIVPLIRDAEAEPHRALDPDHMDELAPSEECAQTLRLLKGSGISCPPANRRDAFTILDYLVRTGFLPRPEDVVREPAPTRMETR